MAKPDHPAPFCFNLNQIRAIVLGADPSNSSDKGKPKTLTKVFGIGDGDARYFRGILANLNTVGLGLEDIYADNLIQDYTHAETSKNKDWPVIARQNIASCLDRLDAVDKKRKLPVFITAEEIYKAVSIQKVIKAKEFYTNPELIPVSAPENKLHRLLVPFYRHKYYSLLNPRWEAYKKRIIEILNKNRVLNDA